MLTWNDVSVGAALLCIVIVQMISLAGICFRRKMLLLLVVVFFKINHESDFAQFDQRLLLSTNEDMRRLNECFAKFLQSKRRQDIIFEGSGGEIPKMLTV